MRGTRTYRGQRGSVLFIVMVLSMALAFAVTVLLHQGQVEARATSVRLGSVRALYEGYGQLELAKSVIGESDYDSGGRNLAVQAALAEPDRKIAGTDVVVEPLTGPSGTWYTLTVSRPYEGVYERVVSMAFREIDFFSSYNLFVSDDPAGISGSPVGAIHTNEEIQFYFPGGLYRHSVTAAGGRAYKSGATTDNTQILGPFNDAVGRIDIDYEGSDRYSLSFIETNAEATFKFDASLDTKLAFYANAGKQWVHVERWSKPEIRVVTYQQLLGYDAVNPHEETYTYVERVSTGFETRTRDVQVFDHYEAVQDSVQTPIYVDDVRTVSVPVYRTETGTKDVPVYRYDTLYKTETKMVWISVDGSSGGTTVGGDDGSLGYWAPQEVQVAYTVKVLDHYDTTTYTYQVIDHYEDKLESYKRLDHYETTYVDRQVPVYTTVTEEYQVETFQDVTQTGTRTVYDQVPIYEERTRTDYIAATRVSQFDAAAPENGLIFVQGNVTSLKGTMVDRVTVASRGNVLVTGNLIYKDLEGDTAYQNGDKPWLPYEPNPSYAGSAILGVIAQQDILYSRSLPDNAELNASMMAITGRVGIEGIALDDAGEVSAYNQLTDQWGRLLSTVFKKNSIRRLGGITTAKRPVETVVKDGQIVSGFNIGQSVFDIGLLEGPPPFFLAYPVPRFFATTIVK